MKNNNPNNYIQEDEIDLKKFIKLLINSKKLIILITLVITTLGAIYTSQKIPQYISTVLIEIGSYDLEVNDYGKKLIESTDSLIQNLKIIFLHKQDVSFGIRAIEDRLVSINTKSHNPEMSIDLLNKIIEYIKNRHSNLLQKIAYPLTSEIKRIDIEIEFINDILFTSNEEEQLRVSYLIKNLDSQSPYLIKEGTNLRLELLKLSQEKNRLELELEFLMQKNPTNTQLIGKIVTKPVNSKKELIIFSSFIIGLFLSIIMVLIIYFLKAFKEE